MTQLQKQLPQWQINLTDEEGVSSDTIEALAFAWLAKQRLSHQSGNLPSVTGATKACCLGGVYLAD